MAAPVESHPGVAPRSMQRIWRWGSCVLDDEVTRNQAMCGDRRVRGDALHCELRGDEEAGNERRNLRGRVDALHDELSGGACVRDEMTRSFGQSN